MNELDILICFIIIVSFFFRAPGVSQSDENPLNHSPPPAYLHGTLYSSQPKSDKLAILSEKYVINLTRNEIYVSYTIIEKDICN